MKNYIKRPMLLVLKQSVFVARKIKKYIILFVMGMIAVCTFSATSFAKLPNIERFGGSYGDLRDLMAVYNQNNLTTSTSYECHHIISKRALGQWKGYVERTQESTRYNRFLLDDPDFMWAPAIVMEVADHEQTLSHYNQARDGLDYQDWQADMIIKKGDVVSVIHEEIEFLRETFGNKYEKAIYDLLEYVKFLQFRHPREGVLTMVNPENPRWYFEFKFGQ